MMRVDSMNFALLLLLALPMLLGIVVVCVLFCFRKTRPAAWLLLGIGMFLGLIAFGVMFSWSARVREAPVVIAENVDRGAINRSRGGPHQRAMRAEDSAVSDTEVERLLGPTIRLPGAGTPKNERAIEAGEGVDQADNVSAELPGTPASSGEPPEPVETTAVDGPPTQSSAPQQGMPTTAEPDEPPAAPGSRAHPSWVDRMPPRTADAYPLVVVTDPFSKRHEAERQVTELVAIATEQVVRELVGHMRPRTPAPDHLVDHQSRYVEAHRLLRQLDLMPGEVRTEVWQDEYLEELDLNLSSGAMPMLRIHALLEFDRDFQQDLQQRWREHEAEQRLGMVGGIAGGVIGLLAVAWALLKFDTATKGYYTKWLLLSGAAVTMGIVVFFIA